MKKHELFFLGFLLTVIVIGVIQFVKWMAPSPSHIMLYSGGKVVREWTVSYWKITPYDGVVWFYDNGHVVYLMGNVVIEEAVEDNKP